MATHMMSTHIMAVLRSSAKREFSKLSLWTILRYFYYSANIVVNYFGAVPGFYFIIISSISVVLVILCIVLVIYLRKTSKSLDLIVKHVSESKLKKNEVAAQVVK